MWLTSGLMPKKGFMCFDLLYWLSNVMGFTFLKIDALTPVEVWGSENRLNENISIEV